MPRLNPSQHHRPTTRCTARIAPNSGGWYTQCSTGCRGRYGDALEWKYVEGRSVEEISERLGIGQTAAQSLLARARVAFREGVEAVFGASADDVLAGLEA